MLNSFIGAGRLTRDPELRYTQNQIPVVSFSIAIDDDYKSSDGEKKTQFVDICAWRNTAEFVSKWFCKGDAIIVSGRLQIRDWTDRDGNKRRSAEIVAENVYFAGSKKKGERAVEDASPYEHTDSDAPPELPPEAQAFADRWGVNVEDGERF